MCSDDWWQSLLCLSWSKEGTVVLCGVTLSNIYIALANPVAGASGMATPLAIVAKFFGSCPLWGGQGQEWTGCGCNKM